MNIRIRRFFALAVAVALLFASAGAEVLALGAKGEAVYALQERLYYLGFLAVSPDGDYGPKTQEGVRDFQAFFRAKGHALPSDGTADEGTVRLLYDDAVADSSYPLKPGDKNGYVRRVQRRLIELGYLYGAADGSYGQKTADAVRAFQLMLLENGVTGIDATGEADAATQDYLYSELLGFKINTPKSYGAGNAAALNPGNLYASACALIDADTGALLFGKEAYAKKYPASTTKVMTLLLALEYPNLSEIVTVPAAAAEIPGDSSRVPIQVGEQLPYEDLVYGLMIRSGNDAANAIAAIAAGSVEAFVDRMNARAVELGLLSTHYTNPHGYHDGDHYTTAADMAELLRRALQNPAFEAIFRARRYTMSATNVRKQRVIECRYDIFNAKSKYYDADAFGGKTGFTTPAGYCFVGAAERNGVRLIAVVFDSGISKYNRWTDAERLFDYGFAVKGV
ncbi:MAG: hypothetical protein GX592_04595 [Clostridiales bacterium]|nr:hypothetical protein [Clostridiales bacterium]